MVSMKPALYLSFNIALYFLFYSNLDCNLYTDQILLYLDFLYLPYLNALCTRSGVSTLEPGAKCGHRTIFVGPHASCNLSQITKSHTFTVKIKTILPSKPNNKYVIFYRF